MKKVLLTLAVLAMLVGCRSQKKVVKTEIATADTCSVSSASTMATERLRWMDSLTLDLDSFEIEWRMAPNHFSKMMGDTAMVASRSSAVTVTDGFAQFTAQPRTGSVVLRAKHASVGKVGRLERNSASCSQQADSLEHHRTSTAGEQTENAKTTIAEPIEMTWVPWAIVGVAVAMFIFVIWRMEKEDEKFNNNHGSE